MVIFATAEDQRSETEVYHLVEQGGWGTTSGLSVAGLLDSKYFGVFGPD